jgi:hypothetical protein
MSNDPNTIADEAYQSLVPGLTPETIAEFRELGLNPEQVELGYRREGEAAHQARQAAQQAEAAMQQAAELATAAQDAVANGEATNAEMAAYLLNNGATVAHTMFVAAWQKEEAEEANFLAADELAFADAEEYIEHTNAMQVQEREQLAQRAQDTLRQLEEAKLQRLADQFEQFVQSTPGAPSIAPAVGDRLVEKIKQEGGALPTTEAEGQALIASALQESSVLEAAKESLRQQVDTEWRLHRKATGKSDGLMTVADIARAEAHFKAARLEQLADTKMIDLDSLKPGPLAEELSSALTEKYADRQAKSTDFHQQVGDIAKRGAEANASRDRGEGIAEERRAYKEAVARAEETALYGTVRTSLGATEAVQETSKDPRLPAGYVDEYGPGGYS